MIPKRWIENALARSMQTGGDFAEIYAEDTRSTGMSVMDGKVENVLGGRRRGVGLRVYKGFLSVYVHGNDMTEAGLMRLAAQAADAVGEIRGVEGTVRLTGSVCRNVHPISLLPCDIEGARKAELLKRAYNAAKNYDPSISQVITSMQASEREVLIANSDGLMVPDRRIRTRLNVQAVASANGESQTGFEGPGALKGFEFLENEIDVEAVAREAAGTAATMLRAENCPAGVMPVIIDGGFGGVIFHEACGHSLEATSVALGNSEFCGKMGQQIASSLVTAVDDGSMPGEWGSTNIDDEGTPTTKLVLIENGILKNYMIDRLNSRRMQMPVTGSGRRQDYTYAPTSRMRNTYIAPGNDDENEIIASAGEALYCKKMGGGSVNPVTGEFNFAVSEGYLVKDGKIDRPVRGATLIGKGADTLMKIDRVGKKMWMAQGMCGSLSGSVPTNVGQPRIRVSSMTVGGR